jgi:hypothetical protein
VAKSIPAVILAALLLPNIGLAKDKTTLPAYVLQAHTVAVIIDPNAGIDLEQPDANKTAQRDVEAALLNWGRFDPTISRQNADLIIVVRKGNGRFVQDTITDPRQNNRPGAVVPTDNGISIGAQHGPQPGIADASNSQSGVSRSQAEIAQQDDAFTVYRGGVEDPLNSSPAWRFVAKKGLHAHDVPAVEAFRKAIAEAEKKAAKP